MGRSYDGLRARCGGQNPLPCRPHNVITNPSSPRRFRADNGQTGKPEVIPLAWLVWQTGKVPSRQKELERLPRLPERCQNIDDFTHSAVSNYWDTGGRLFV